MDAEDSEVGRSLGGYVLAKARQTGGKHVIKKLTKKMIPVVIRVGKKLKQNGVAGW